jgi:hypothetical protein
MAQLNSIRLGRSVALLARIEVVIFDLHGVHLKPHTGVF